MRARPEVVFLCRLALNMGKSLREVGALSASELVYWMAYQRIEPFGDLVRDWHVAQTPHLLATLHARRGQRPKFSDFLLAAAKPARAMTPEESVSFFAAFAAAHNENVKEDRHGRRQ